MIDLVTLAQAKIQVRVTNPDHDLDLAMKVTQASAAVMDYMKLSTPPDEWITNSSPITYEIPAKVQLETLRVVGFLFFNRESGTGDMFADTLLDRCPSMA